MTEYPGQGIQLERQDALDDDIAHEPAELKRLTQKVRDRGACRHRFAPVLRQRTRAARVAPAAGHEGGAQQPQRHTDRTERVVDQHGATVRYSVTPVDDVSARRSETVRAVDVEKVDVAVHVTEGVNGHLADVRDTLRDTGLLEVGGEGGVIAVSEMLIGRYLLGAAVTATVRVDRHDPRAGGCGIGENDQRTAAETPDLNDLSALSKFPCAFMEPLGLLIGQPTLNVGDSG